MLLSGDEKYLVLDPKCANIGIRMANCLESFTLLPDPSHNNLGLLEAHPKRNNHFVGSALASPSQLTHIPLFFENRGFALVIVKQKEAYR